MSVIRTSKLLEAMDDTPIEDIRNICIIAHVDHGSRGKCHNQLLIVEQF